ILGNSLPSESAKRVLLVDQDEAFGNVLEEVLSGQGYSISQVLSPKAGLAHIRTGAHDVVLLNTDCWESTPHESRELLSAATDLPVSLPIIGFGWAKYSKASLEVFQSGALDLLEQPLDIQELRFTIDRACRRSELARELAAAQRMLTAARVEG